MTDSEVTELLIQRASEGCEGPLDESCHKTKLPAHLWCDPCRCSIAATTIQRLASPAPLPDAPTREDIDSDEAQVIIAIAKRIARGAASGSKSESQIEYEIIDALQQTSVARLEDVREDIDGTILNQKAAPLPDAAPSPLEVAAQMALTALRDLMEREKNCGEWGTECPLQDAGKPWHGVDQSIKALAALLDPAPSSSPAAKEKP